MEFTIVGKSEVGKTLFMLQFAEYFAEENGFDCIYQTRKGVHLRKISDLGNASDIYNKGIKKQYLPECVTLYTEVQQKFVKFIDTNSLQDGIQYNNEHRKNISKTLVKILESNHLLHIIDYAQLEKNGLDPVDEQLFNLCKRKDFYIILFNKADLSKKMIAIQEYQKKIAAPIYPISAKNKEGFFHIYQTINSIIKEPVMSR